MNRSYDVVVVGAGIVGLSVAYYLKKKGCSRVLVLEKEKSWITGSTARANGGFRQQFSTAVNIRLSQISVPIFEHFDEEFGTDIGLRQYGYLFVTSSREGEQALRANLQVQQALDVPAQWVGTDFIRNLTPFLRWEDLRGGTFCGRDGYADAYSIAKGFGRAACRLGAEVETDSEVLEVISSGGKVLGIRTPHERITAAAIVNAAGPHAARIGAMAGVSLPIHPVRRMLAMSEDFDAIPEEIPMIVDTDTGFLMRRESGKVLLAWSDPDEPPGFNLSFDPSFIDKVAEKAVARVPVLADARMNPRRSWAGLYAVTPDHHCILGEAPGLAGFFVAAGFSGHGMMHSPATGMILADLILDGTTGLLDVHALRLSRFAEDDLIEESVVL